MLDRTLGAGRIVWRCAPIGSEQVMLNRFTGMDSLEACISRKTTSYVPGSSTLRVHWAKNGMTVLAADLFETKAEALAEFRKRRDVLRAVGSDRIHGAMEP